ncbi:phosphopantetheine-binding protein [Mollicutes bacterium LVI A0039]|nr:phosphopantetheine-binding protein [Mollicutes bacterium LVI A0039]
MELNRESIIAEIGSRFDVDSSTITDATEFKNDLKADSIDLYQMVVEYEDELGITLEDDVMAEIKTVGDLLKAVIK